MKTQIYLTICLLIILCSCLNNKENTSPQVEQAYSQLWKFKAGEGTDSLWYKVDYNDSDWIEVSSNILLKDQNVKLEDGFGWYRKTIRLNDDMKKAVDEKGAIVLNLGQLAACDEVYFNGKLIGKTGSFPHDYMGYFDHNRYYTVYKQDIITEGENLIAIKFHDGWGVGGFLDSAQLKIVSAETKDKLQLEVNISDSDYIFTEDNNIQISVNIENNNEWDISTQLIVLLTSDAFQATDSVCQDVQLKANTSFDKSFTQDKLSPGFYRYTIQLKQNGEILQEKKINVGYEPEKIESLLDNKDDFKEFWDDNLKQLAKIDPKFRLTLQPEYSKLDYNVYLVEMRSFQNELIRGYYAKPKRAGKHPVIVEYMGYGSKPYPPNQWWDGFAYFILSIRGQGLNEADNHYGKWITYGLDNKNKYYYRGAFLDVIRALDFVSSRPEIDATKIAVRGGSQGGALSFVAAALDRRVKVAAPTIPFLSDYPDYFKIAHWPKSDIDEYMSQHPDEKWNDVYDLLSYFDIKNLAQWIECPIIMGIGVQDEVCPPHINFAAYNQVKSEKKWMAFPQYGHSTGKKYHDASIKFIKEKLNIN